ncbi:BrnT family toxin [Kineobactrum salinum]|uniref:BrnT family toxin n=1 Tax=Kineobactrum salinum TaxID=2708301 RepID=A0A6C0U3U2_9GAMM|nr:BrnT family toxin [Kineobactrum salinum]QIB66089.1 BrnT family toxin [Kineobactrum salinum]
MLNLNKITGFDWDDGNSRKSKEKHDVSQAEAEQVFFNEPLLLLLDDKHSQKATRYHAYGKTNGDRRLHIAFTLRERDTLIRVISARNMHRKERTIYDKA